MISQDMIRKVTTPTAEKCVSFVKNLFGGAGFNLAKAKSFTDLEGALRMALPILLGSLGKKQVKVLFKSGLATASTDLDTMIQIPNISFAGLVRPQHEFASYDDWHTHALTTFSVIVVMVLMLFHHESAHVRHTKGSKMEHQPHSALGGLLLNVLCDVRIEGRQGIEFPGSAMILALGNKLLDEMFADTKADATKHEPTRILCASLSKSMRAEVLSQPSDSRVHTREEAVKVFGEKLVGEVEVLARNAAVASDTYACNKEVNAILDLLKQASEDQPQPQPQPQQGQGQSSDGENSGQQEPGAKDESKDNSKDQSGDNSDQAQGDQQQGSQGDQDDQGDDGKPGNGDAEGDQQSDENAGSNGEANDEGNQGDSGNGEAEGDQQADGSNAGQPQGNADGQESAEAGNPSAGQGAGEGDSGNEVPSQQPTKGAGASTAAGNDVAGSDEEGYSEAAKQAVKDMLTNAKEGDFEDIEKLLGEVLANVMTAGKSDDSRFVRHGDLAMLSQDQLMANEGVARRLTYPMQEALEEVLVNKTKARNFVNDDDSGRLAGNKLFRAAMNDGRLYRHRIPGERLDDIAVMFEIDVSGSMSESVGGGLSRSEVAHGAVSSMGNVLDELEIPFGVLGFDGKLYDFKPFDVDWRQAKRRFPVMDNGGTVAAPAIRHGVRELAKSGASRRINLVITDGDPGDKAETVEAIRQAAAMADMETRVILIGYTPGKATPFHEAIKAEHISYANTFAELPRAVFKILERDLL